MNAPRLIAGLVALSAAGALALVLWLQLARGYAPCSLCVYQRAADFAMFTAVLPGLFWTGWVRRGLWWTATATALTGAALAGWQWHLATRAAHTVESCTAVNLFPAAQGSGPWGHGLASALSGHGSCAVAGARSLAGWPMTHWSIAFFLICAALLGLAQWLAGRSASR